MSKEKPVVMVIEDESLLLEAIVTKLEHSEFEVVSFTNGGKALDYLQSNPRLPDIIWLDYYLTDMNGLEFMQSVKANSKWASIQVFVISNSASPEKVKNMLALGAKKYILKAEYRLDQIVDLLREFLKDA
ncbi:MAG: response regulator [Patescibacteria group bacterium]|nr:response regulator [Patescibacteria group bacterium]MDE2588935.1 response regulator [Patescibacteria group bacterium]